MKVLILTCSYGEGHNSASQAIYEEFKQRNIKVSILDTAEFGNRQFNKIGKNIFNNIAIRTPRIFAAAYKLGEVISNDKVKSPVYMSSLIHAKKLKDYIVRNKYDVVICSHLFSMQTITFLQKRGLKIQSYAVVTDYCYIPFIEETNLDKYFIAHKSLMPEFTRKGIKKFKLIPLGIPIKNSFKKQISIEEAKKELNIKTEKPVILVMTGGLGCGNAVGICKNILQNNDFFVIVLAGRNKNLIEELERKINNPNLAVVPFTDKVNTYLSASSVVISKPGGISSTEIAAKNKPLIHFNAYLGVEINNRKFFSKHKLAVYSKNINDLEQKIKHLLKTKQKYKQKVVNPNATSDIVDFIIKKYN